MSKGPAMIIAPGHPMDRQWWSDRSAWSVHFLRPAPLMFWTPDQDPLEIDNRNLGTATLRRFHCPGWKIGLEFYVDDALCIGSEDGGPIIPTGYVLPGFIQGEALELLPLMHWKLNRRQEWWELWPAGGEDYVARVTQEFMDYAGRVRTQEVVTAEYRVPLPDEAWRPKPPPEVPMPRRTLRELLIILDSANKQSDES